MQVVSITAAYGSAKLPPEVHVAVAATFDEAVLRINMQLRRVFDREIGHRDGWAYLDLPDTNVRRSTPLGEVVFKVERHAV